MKDIKISEIMVHPVITVEEGAHLSEVEEKIRTHKIRHIPVVDSDQRVVGIITQRDLYRTAHPRRTEEGYHFEKEELDEFILKYVMSPDPVTLSPDDTLDRAVMIMATRKFGCIPIVRPDKTLAGVITQIDVLKWLHRQLSV